MAKFALSAFADEAGSTLSEQIKALCENGIDYIEPRNIGGRGILEIEESELREIRRTLDENRIKVNSLGSPIGKFPIDEPIEKHMADFERALRAAEILGTTNIRMFSFFVEQDSLAKYRGEVKSRLRTMCRLAARRGIRLCHENESRVFGQMPSEVLELAIEIPELYFIFDPANYRMNNADVLDGIDATLVRPAYLHIKDAIFDTQTIVPAGEGEGRIAEIIDMVNESTDEVVFLTLEPHLHVFDAYKSIDEHELRGKYSFKSNREAFDFAASALKNLLIKSGYRKDENNLWIK